jgi:hypothetical protein
MQQQYSVDPNAYSRRIYNSVVQCTDFDSRLQWLDRLSNDVVLSMIVTQLQRSSPPKWRQFLSDDVIVAGTFPHRMRAARSQRFRPRRMWNLHYTLSDDVVAAVVVVNQLVVRIFPGFPSGWLTDHVVQLYAAQERTNSRCTCTANCQIDHTSRYVRPDLEDSLINGHV